MSMALYNAFKLVKSNGDMTAELMGIIYNATEPFLLIWFLAGP